MFMYKPFDTLLGFLNILENTIIEKVALWSLVYILVNV